MDSQSVPRERIAQAALRIFRNEGVAGLSMRKIAADVGVTAPALYRHFENKDALLGEIVASGLHELERYLRPAFEAATPYERVRRLTDRFLDFALEQPNFFEVAFLDPGGRMDRLPEELARPMWTVFRAAIAEIEACMKLGEIRDDDPFSTALLIWAAAHGLVTLYRTDRSAVDPEQFRNLYRTSIDRLFRGLRPEGRS
jgi:AcrR family transcriptional regulator